MNIPYRPEGEGTPLTVTPANPAAGAQYTLTVPAGFMYRFIGGKFRFVTSAVVANRVVNLEYRTSGAALVFAKWRRAASHVASETKLYYYHPNAPAFETSIANDIYAPAWFRIPLVATDELAINIILIDAGDQISDIVLKFLIWQVAP